MRGWTLQGTESAIWASGQNTLLLLLLMKAEADDNGCRRCTEDVIDGICDVISPKLAHSHPESSWASSRDPSLAQP